MEKFGLTQIQAQAVLELQLQRLSQLERLKIQEEYAALKKRITELRRILKDERLVYAIIVQELKEVKEEYGDERRTEIRDEAVSELRPEDLVKEEDVAIVYTSSGYIKRTSLTSYKFQARGGKGRRGIEMKAEDIVEDLYICSTHSYLLVFTNQGRLYWLKALDVPDVGVSGRGKPIANLVEFQPGEKPASVVRRQGVQREPVRRHADDRRHHQEDAPVGFPERAAGRHPGHEHPAEERALLGPDLDRARTTSSSGRSSAGP